MSIDVDKNKSHILQVYNDVLDDRSPTNWALFGYEGQTNTLKVVGFGDEGLEELVDELNASKIMYGILRVSDPKTSRTKTILLNWQGEGAPNLRKGICARHIPDIKRMLKGIHITISARTEEDVDSEMILDAITKATSTEYNFKDRSELPEKSVPVKKIAYQFWTGDVCGAAGTNYKRTNPQTEIDANRRNKFWEAQEAEEKVRKEQEIKRKEDEAKRLEKERIERELRDCKHREELNKERNARILSEKKAESVAMETGQKRDAVVWEKEMNNQRAEEEERIRRADKMRLDRKKEAESLIGRKTHQTRSLFEFPSMNSSSSSQIEVGQRVSRPPPRKIKDFQPSNVEESVPSQKESFVCKKSVGTRWPPRPEEIVHQSPATVPGKIAEWKPREEAHPSSSYSPNTNSTKILSEAASGPITSSRVPSSIDANSVARDVQATSSNSYKTFSQSPTEQHSLPSPQYTSSSSFTPTSPPPDFGSLSSHMTPPTSPSHSTYLSPTSSHIDSNFHVAPTSPPPEFASTSPLHSASPPPQATSPPPAFASPPLAPTQYTPQVTQNGDERVQRTDPSDYKPRSHNHYSNNVVLDQVDSDPMALVYTSDGMDDLGSVCMTYEVDGVEYQILPEHGLCARALYDYQAADDTEITFDPGDIITNIDQIDVGWWQGVSAMGLFGLFPANYVELINGTKIH